MLESGTPDHGSDVEDATVFQARLATLDAGYSRSAGNPSRDQVLFTDADKRSALAAKLATEPSADLRIYSQQARGQPPCGARIKAGGDGARRSAG